MPVVRSRAMLVDSVLNFIHSCFASLVSSAGSSFCHWYAIIIYVSYFGSILSIGMHTGIRPRGSGLPLTTWDGHKNLKTFSKNRTIALIMLLNDPWGGARFNLISTHLFQDTTLCGTLAIFKLSTWWKLTPSIRSIFKGKWKCTAVITTSQI